VGREIFPKCWTTSWPSLSLTIEHTHDALPFASQSLRGCRPSTDAATGAATTVPSLIPLASRQTQGPRPLSKYLLFSPSGSSKHLRSGSARMMRHFLTTRTESWGFIKSSAQNKVVHMELSFRLAQTQHRRLHGGYHCEIPSRNRGGFSPTASPLNPMMAPAVICEYRFCLPLSDRLWPPTQQKTRGLLSESSTPGTTGRQLRHKILDTIDSL
jgi:hypothetical protein